MSEKRITCPKCPRYDQAARRCLDGKANPRRKSDSIELATLLGPQALCCYNPFREGFAFRMYFPHRAIKPQARLRLRPTHIEIEIEADPEESEA